VDRVTGLDIAPSMVAKAEQINRCGERCTFLVNDRPDLSVLGGRVFDIVYCCRVLQHMPTELSARYIRELVRAVRPETGVLVFQIPSEPSKTLIGRAMRVVPTPLIDRVRKMKMHGAGPARVRELVRQAGGEVVDVTEDSCAGPNWKSFRYTVRRPADRGFDQRASI
jgi:SAM-dependent methyltransferase